MVFEEGIRNLRTSPTWSTKTTQKAASKSYYNSVRHHSSSVSGDKEVEDTSDEESLVVMRKKQAQVVRNIESRVHELIEAHYRRYPQWKKCYDPELR